MSVSSDVRAALSANTEVKVVGVVEEHHFVGWTHTVRIVVAPRNPLTSTKKLQKLMMSLVPQTPTMKDDFWGGREWISLGKLYFDEQIGSVREDSVLKYEITDPDFEPGEDYVDRKKLVECHETRPLMRRTWVYLYPSIGMAERDIANGEVTFSAKVADLERPSRRLSFF
jgi:hypothetical protein